MSENYEKKRTVNSETFSGNISPLIFNNIAAEPTECKYFLDIRSANEYLANMAKDVLGNDIVSAKFKYYPKSEGVEIETAGKSTTLKSDTVAEVVIPTSNAHFIKNNSVDNDDPFTSGATGNTGYDNVLKKFLQDFGIADDAPDSSKGSTVRRSVYTGSTESKILLLEPLKILCRFYDANSYVYNKTIANDSAKLKARPTKIRAKAEIGTSGDNKGRLIGYTIIKIYSTRKDDGSYNIFKPGKNRDDDDYRDSGRRDRDDDYRRRDDRDKRRNNEFRKNYNNSEKYVK